VIERLGKGEGARLRAIRLRALADAPDAFALGLDEAQAWDAERWDAQVEALPTFVWREGAVDLGMVRCAPHDREPNAAYLVSMWVAPEGRGRGIGDALVAEVLAFARTLGVGSVVLDVGAWNRRAQALYERAGFVVSDVAGAPSTSREAGCEVQMRVHLGRGEPAE
jgi:ribosomal protein S18 acetylase RimI-like enzyme